MHFGRVMHLNILMLRYGGVLLMTCLYVLECLIYMGCIYLTTNHVLNRGPHKKLEKTCYALWKVYAPNYSYLKVYGGVLLKRLIRFLDLI